MKQTFNPKRFIRYSIYQLMSHRNNLLLITGGAAVVLFTFLLILISNHGIRNAEGWFGTFIGTFVFSGLLLIGHSFPAMRKKKSTINFLMIPASNFEKFFYEFLIKIVLFTLLYPLFFKIIGELAFSFAQFISPYKSFTSYTMHELTELRNNEFFSAICWAYIFGASIAFAGASAFKKLPLLKTIIVLAVILGAISGYMYFLVEKTGWEHGMEYFAMEVLKLNQLEEPENPGRILSVFPAISSIVAFGYAFFNLKEREI